jgi:hypothetical protein
MGRIGGLWVYHELGGSAPRPDDVAERAHRHGIRWLSAQAIDLQDGTQIVDAAWLKAMRHATRVRGMRMGVHGYFGRPHPRPAAEATAFHHAIEIADADFAIVDAEIEYEHSATPDSKTFVHTYRRLRPDLTTYFSSFGRPQFHSGLGWQAWADGGFLGMPQAYENLNASQLKPAQCVADWARFFDNASIRPTLGCFSEPGHPALSLSRLIASVHEVKDLGFNIYRHGTVTDAELKALARLR